MTRMMILGLALSLLASPFAQAATDAPPASRMRTQLQDVASKQCAAAKRVQASAKSDDDKAVASLMVAANCECLPAGIDQSLKGHKNPDALDRQTAGKLLQDAAAVCHAGQLRASAEPLCLRDKTAIGNAKDRPEYCGCLAAGMRRLNDKEIIDASLASHAALMASARAQDKGETAPAKPQTVIDRVEETCRQTPDAYR